MKQTIIKQFAKPTGWLGAVAGWIMANRGSNQLRNKWTVDLLQLQPGMQVLEIGYGPGLAIEYAVQQINAEPQIKTGAVWGLDHSALMQRKASLRNKALAEQGPLHLLTGSVENCDDLLPPHLRGGFDRIFAINAAMFWPNRAQVFAQLRPWLKPGGWLALTFQPRSGEKTNAAAAAMAQRFAAELDAAGYRQMRHECLERLTPNAICVLGQRGA